MNFSNNEFFFRLKIVNGKIDCDEEGEIDESLNGLQQDDPILIDAIKNYYLMSAATMPYKIQPANLQPPAIYVSCTWVPSGSFKVSTGSFTQCGNFRISLSFRFYVKSMLENGEVLKLPSLQP